MPTKSGLPGWFPEDFQCDPALLAAVGIKPASESDGLISAQLSSPRMVTEAMTMTYDQTEATLSQIRTQLDHAVSGDAVAAITELADTLPAALPDDPETVGHVADGQTALAEAQAALQRAVDAAQAALKSHELNNGPAHEAAQSAGGAPERGYVTDGLAGQIELAFNPAEPRGKGGKWTGGPLYHGTRAVLNPGDLIAPPAARGVQPRYKFGSARQTAVSAKNVYVTTRLHDARGFSTEYVHGDPEGPPRVYEVEPSGPVLPDRHDADGTSFRSHHPMRVVREVGKLENGQWSDKPDLMAEAKRPDASQFSNGHHLLTTDLAAWEHEDRGKGGEWVAMGGGGWEGRDKALQEWFHPQQLDATKVKHPRSGYMVDSGLSRRVSRPAESQHGNESLGNEGPPTFDVVDHGDPNTPAYNSLAYMMGKPMGTEPIQHVYRGMSESEWQQAQKRGYIQSDKRGTVSGLEGTNAAVDPSSAVSYLPPDGNSRVVKIAVRPEDKWFTIRSDSYLRTRQQIPLDRVVTVSPPIRKHGKHDDLQVQQDVREVPSPGATIQS